MDNINYTNAIEQLLNILPEFREKYQHMMDTFGEIFPYVLIGSGLVEFTVKNYETLTKSNRKNVQAADILNRIAAFLELCVLSNDEELIELIRIGFMEHLDSNSNNFEGIVSMLKPESRKILNEVKN